MKRFVSVLLVCFIITALSACGLKSLCEKKLVGTWRNELSYSGENGEEKTLYNDITFNSDGTGTGINGRWLDYPPEEVYDFNYIVAGEKIYLYFPYDGYRLDGSFCFEDELLVLTLNFNPENPRTAEYYRVN